MTPLDVTILDTEQAGGDWLLRQLDQIHVSAKWLPNASDLLAEAEEDAPTVCLVALRPPVEQVHALITHLTQEPRFAKTAFIVMGPAHYKHTAFEAGADDYLTTPPDVIELRKRVRLYLDRAALAARVVAETRLLQEMDALSDVLSGEENGDEMDRESLTLLEHAAALTEERTLFDLILTYTAEAISLVDPDGILLYGNPAYWALVGDELGVQTGEPIRWPPVTDQAGANRAIASAIERARPWQGDIAITLPDGERLPLATSIQPAFDANRELAGFVVTQQNAAERRAAENLTTRFLSGAVFEMRTPLANLKMRLYLLSEAPDEQRSVHLHALERDTERLSHLVESVLELSRLDAGMIQFHLEPTDLNRLVAEALARHAASAQDQGVALGLTRDETLPAVPVDPAQVARALGLVIENAIQHTPEAGRVAIHLVPEAWNGGDFVTIQVTDSGTGIAPDALPHIFERFYRSARTREARIRGVGLGLSIAQEIIARHNGHITVESEVDQGSTFTIWLPVDAP